MKLRYIKRIIGECLLISSLPGKASGMHGVISLSDAMSYDK